MRQTDYIMPKMGQIWKHYGGDEYAIMGIALDPDGLPMVIYRPCNLAAGADTWSAPDGPLYVQPLGRFLAEVDLGMAKHEPGAEGAERFKKRFTHSGE